MDIKISIVTVTYNSDKYIKNTLDSILNQQDFLYEYWIIDGGSKDKTIDIVKTYVPDFNGKLKYISEKDEGIYDAMNKGISLASGNVIGIVNSDDYYNDFTLSKVNEAFSNNSNIGCLFSDAISIDKDGNDKGILKSSIDGLKYGMALMHPTCFVRADVYKKIGLYNTKFKIAADYDFGMRMKNNGILMIKCKYPLTKFREGGASVKNQRIGMKDTYSIQKQYIGTIWAIFIYLKASIRLLIKGSTF